MTIWNKRSRRILAAVGLVVALAPIPGAALLVDHQSRLQGERELHDLAHGALERAEAALDDGMETLSQLTMMGVNSCGEREVDIMKRAIYAQYWILETGLTTPDGTIYCNHIGESMTADYLSPAHNLTDEVALRLVELSERRFPGIMLYKSRADLQDFSVIVPSDVVTQSPTTGPLSRAATGSLRLSDGALVGALFESGSDMPPSDTQILDTSVTSERYPVAVEVAAPLNHFREQNSSLNAYSLLGGSLFSLTILALSMYVLTGAPAEISRLQDAASREEFIPYYQPVVDIATSRLIGCEVLMRWKKRDGSIGMPGEFIQLAEITGLASVMTRSLMRQVRDDLEGAFGARPDLKIGINLFDNHFDDLKTVADVQKIFGGSAIRYSQLMFELTERQPLRDIERAKKIIGEFRRLGAVVALDDAGTGHGGLAYLHQLDVAAVKIDKMFIDTLNGSQDPSPIVGSLIRLSHDLGMEVVAEGVETMEQLEHLADLKADSAQGYLFAPALPADAFVSLVEATVPRASRASNVVAQTADVPRTAAA